MFPAYTPAFSQKGKKFHVQDYLQIMWFEIHAQTVHSKVRNALYDLVIII